MPHHFRLLALVFSCIVSAAQSQDHSSRRLQCLRSYDHGVYVLERHDDSIDAGTSSVWRVDLVTESAIPVFSLASRLNRFDLIGPSVLLTARGKTFKESRIECYERTGETWISQWQEPGYVPCVDERHAMVYWTSCETGRSHLGSVPTLFLLRRRDLHANRTFRYEHDGWWPGRAFALDMERCRLYWMSQMPGFDGMMMGYDVSRMDIETESVETWISAGQREPSVLIPSADGDVWLLEDRSADGFAELVKRRPPEGRLIRRVAVGPTFQVHGIAEDLEVAVIQEETGIAFVALADSRILGRCPAEPWMHDRGINPPRFAWRGDADGSQRQFLHLLPRSGRLIVGTVNKTQLHVTKELDLLKLIDGTRAAQPVPEALL